jgi:hypothetical protein
MEELLMRPIDADALYKNLGFAEKCKDCGHQYNSVFCESSTWQVVCDAIYEAPTIDAVPVVRCVDCDYWDELEKGVGVCKRLVEAMWVDYTDFCSFAENKDDITYGEREDDEQERD